ncbi:MAG TPA: PAS domain-containing protein, partial [Gammaproteobacteria bacterium]|nr:PAS domain-containing protein [Gammaproteobacteria bacterium]
MQGIRRSTWFIASILIIEVVSLSALVWNSVRIITSSHDQLIESSASQVNHVLAQSVAPALASGDTDGVQRTLNLLHSDSYLVYVTVQDTDGRVVGALGTPPARFRPDSGVRGAHGDDVFDTASAITLHGQRVGTLHTGHSLQQGRAFTAQTRLQNTAIAGVEIVLTILATLLLGLFFTRNLRRLEEGAQALAEGDYGYRIPVKSQDEFAHVAGSFNRMADYLTGAHAELEEKNRVLERQARHFRTLLDGVEAVVVEGDPGTLQLTYVSQEAGNLLGYPLEEWFRPGFWAEHVHPEDREELRSTVNEHTTPPASFSCDFRMLHQDGHPVWVRAINAVDRDEDGHLILRGLLLDVTEEKRSAERII